MGRGDPWTHHKMEETMEAPSWLPFMHFMVCPGVTAPHFIEKDLLPGKAPTILNGTRLRTLRAHLGPQALTVEHPDEGDLHPRGT